MNTKKCTPVKLLTHNIAQPVATKASPLANKSGIDNSVRAITTTRAAISKRAVTP